MTLAPALPLPRPTAVSGRTALAACGLAALAGPLAAVSGTAAPAAALLTVLAVARRPPLGAYLYLLLSPLVVGIARGDLLGALRPNEALLLLLLAGLALHLAGRTLAGQPWRPAWNRVDRALLLLALAGSVLPLLARYGRGRPISADDLLYAAVLWKYLLLHRLFREAVTTPAQVATCLRLALLAAAAVAVIGLLQVGSLLGVPELLAAWYDQPFAGSDGPVATRATSTVAHSFGVAGIMAMSLAIVLARLPEVLDRRPLLAAGGLFLLGAIAAAQLSGYLGLAITLTVAALVAGPAGGGLRRQLVLLAPFAALAAFLLWPVVDARLSGFAGPAGLPPSWLGRLDNLERFVWPELFTDLNWVLGVRPAARIPAPEPWREWVYIESGYAWLLWTGGVPLLLAFLHLVRVAVPDLLGVIRAQDQGPVRTAATASLASLLALVVLMLFDPHLTMRGSADLLFPLLALAFTGATPAANAASATTSPARPHPERSRLARPEPVLEGRNRAGHRDRGDPR